MDRYQKFLCEKAKKKKDFLGKNFPARLPVIFCDISKSKNFSEDADLLKGLDEIGLTTLVILPREEHIRGSKNIHHLTEQEKEKARKAADFEINFDGNLNIIWKNGCVPIGPLNGDTTLHYNPIQEEGNGFYFKNPTKWEVFAAVIRALETYQFPYDWENVIKEILKKVKNEAV